MGRSMNDNLTPFLITFFLFLEGLFSGSEIALVAVDAMELKEWEEKGSKSAKLALKVLKKPELFLTSTVFGTYLCMVTSTALATSLIGEIYTILFLSPFLLIFGEIIPKTIFQQRATYLTLKIIYPIWLISHLFHPLIFLVSSLTKLFMPRRVGRVDGPFITREELRLVLKIGGPKNYLKAKKKVMIGHIFDFSKTIVKEVMVPLIEIKGVEKEASLAEAIEVVKKSGLSRLPVYQERVDNIIGIINSLDLLTVQDPNQGVQSLIQPVFYVPETKPVDELLLELQKKGEHLAIVVDEYGGAVGLASIEDILEEIVGEIEDEYNTKEQMFKRISPKKYLFNARMEIDKINQFFNIRLPKGDYETLGGFILEKLGRIPRKGEVVRYQNLTLAIEKADSRSLKEISVRIE